ncbi:aspartic peptidase domain-containing protein [Fennellomyces sp. T-0311]|nr:aspartic peptidase domain-containing protein [Fennellomyces sp. T-0311]
MHCSVLLLLTATLAEAATTIKLPIYKRLHHERRQDSNRTSISRLYNDEGSEYLIRVGVGSPPQNFTLALDTGSADLWIPSSQCPQDACPLARFNDSRSNTFTNTSQPFNIVYGIGAANGTYVRDTVQVGRLQVKDQVFGLAHQTDNIVAPGLSAEDRHELLTDHDDDDRHEIANGIFGLGYPELAASSSNQNYPFVFNLALQGLIAEPVFSINMGSIFDDGWSGEILFGGIDPKYKDRITYSPVVSFQQGAPHTYWMSHGHGIRLFNQENNSVIVDHKFQEKRGFIIDTGTTLTYMDQAIADQLVKAAAGPDRVVLDNASGTYIVPCSIYTSPTRLELDLVPEGNNTDVLRIGVPIRDLVIPLDDDDLDEATQCMFGIAPWLAGEKSAQQIGNQGFVLVGDTVLRSTYLVFDMGHNRIGFAAAQGRAGVTRESLHDNKSESSPSRKRASLWLLLLGVIILLQ